LQFSSQEPNSSHVSHLRQVDCHALEHDRSE
jgi:hypothetical protein